MTVTQEQDSATKYAEKIAKLLAKAESTNSQQEAEAFIAKAQELMTTYAISEAMLQDARNGNSKQREEIVEKHLDYSPPRSKAASAIGVAIARANGCKVLVSDLRKYSKVYRVHIIGFESDVARVQMLDSSVRIQMQSALTTWWADQRKNNEAVQWMTGSEKDRTRRDFIFGYANGLSEILHQANKAGKDEAVKAEAKRTKTDEKSASDSVALVLRSRTDQVNDWVDEKYGKSLRSGRASRMYSGRLANARSDGAAAGRRANVNPNIGGGGGGALNA